MLTAEATGDEERLLTSQVKYRRLNEEYERFSKDVGLRTQTERMYVEGFSYKQGAKATKAAVRVEKLANSLYNFGDTKANVDAYLKNKHVHDLLDRNGIKFISQINSREFVVDAGTPTVKGYTGHALSNLQSKKDREGMTITKAQEFVDNAKLTVFQWDRETLKFLSENGYSVLNMDGYLVTAVPQKWRKKYDNIQRRFRLWREARTLGTIVPC